ncbi:MAG: hypothetical protein ACLGI2_01450 [Acidimicrobiia bacterium]
MSYWGDQRQGSGSFLPPVYEPPRNRDDGVVSERTARLTITILAASFIVLMIGLVVFFTVKTLRQRETAADVPVVEQTRPTTPEEAARVVGGLGPPQGTQVANYITARKEALAAATGDRIAVVSFGKYQTEARAKSLVAPAEVVALLAAPPGGQPEVVTSDLATWAREQTAEVRAERAEIEKLIPTARNDPSFQAFYRTELERLDKLLNAIRPGGELVFGVVVKSATPTLQQLGAKPDVRLVDVGPTADPVPRNDYRGLRPEETTKANEPNTRPL